MNKQEHNRLNSYRVIMGVLDSMREYLEGIPVFSGYLDEYKDLIHQIEQNASATAKGTKPVTTGKRDAREKLTRSATMVSAIISAYAYDIKDIDLEKDVKYSYTDLKKSRENDFVARVGIILDKAEEHASSLEGYLLTKERLAQFREDLEVFIELIANAGEVKARVSASYKQVRVLMKQTEELLTRKIDRMVLAMKLDHEKFYYKYQQARKIKDLG